MVHNYVDPPLWTPALILALTKPQLHFRYYWTKRNGTLEIKGCNSIATKLSTTSHRPVGTSGNAYSSGPQELHLQQQPGGTRQTPL